MCEFRQYGYSVQEVKKMDMAGMDMAGMVSNNENCGFFDLYSTESFEIVNPGKELARVLGMKIGESPEGRSYIELVCSEDREQVAENLREVMEEGLRGEAVLRPGRCIRHRLVLPDESVVMVSLTFGFDPKGYLICSVMRLYDEIGRETENKYRSNNVLEAFAVSMAVVFINSEGQIIVRYANDDFYRMIGWNRLEFKDFFNECLGDGIIYPDDLELFRQTLTSLGEERRETVMEACVLHMNGEVSVNNIHMRFVNRENERALITLVFDDITERKRLRRELLIQNERYNIIQQNSEQTIFDYDTEKDFCIFSGNKARMEKYLSVYSYNDRTNEVGVEDFFHGQFALNIMSKDDYYRVCEAFSKAIVEGTDGELDFEAYPPGVTVGKWFRCTYSAVKDDAGNVVRIVGRLKNIDKQKKAELMMERRMECDLLTGLLNKETGKAQIRLFLADKGAFSGAGEKFHVLMILDLDDFHLINECFGHTFGDNVLKEFASDIKSSFRDTDIVARLVGDRFMVLMKDVTQKFAVKKAGRLCRRLIKDYGVQKKVTVSCSIGVAFFGRDAFDFDELYQYADRAAYEAKRNGKNAYFIYDSELQADYSLVKEISGTAATDSIKTKNELGEIDINMVDIAFSLLTASDDIYGSLDILLRTVGRKYNLSAVSVYIKGYGKGEKLKKVSRWISNRNLPIRDGRSPLITHHVDLDAELGAEGVRSISDVGVSNLNPTLKNLLKNDGMIALVICALEGRSGENFGYMVFTQFERRRKWSQKEINTFRYLAKILAVALAEKYAERSIVAEGIEDMLPMEG